MGYTTYFSGSLEFSKPVTEDLEMYIEKFSNVRHMKRDNEKIKELYPNWKELCFNGNLGDNGAYFVGDMEPVSNEDKSILDCNLPPTEMPGLYCQWIIDSNGELRWDGDEYFYEYEFWLEYLIHHFFAPEGYVLNGEILYEGEERDDFGTIIVKNNVVTMQPGIHTTDLSEINDNVLIQELQSRGYSVTAEKKEQTNIQRIKSLSVEELAHLNVRQFCYMNGYTPAVDFYTTNYSIFDTQEAAEKYEREWLMKETDDFWNSISKE